MTVYGSQAGVQLVLGALVPDGSVVRLLAHLLLPGLGLPAGAVSGPDRLRFPSRTAAMGQSQLPGQVVHQRRVRVRNRAGVLFEPLWMLELTFGPIRTFLPWKQKPEGSVRTDPSRTGPHRTSSEQIYSLYPQTKTFPVTEPVRNPDPVLLSKGSTRPGQRDPAGSAEPGQNWTRLPGKRGREGLVLI